MNTDVCLWHLRPPFKDSFDRSHWWNTNHGQAALVSAVWEVLRRHPRAKALHGPKAEPKNLFEWFIREHGLKAWTGLTRAQQEEWRHALKDVPPQRGFDPRPIYSVTAESVDLKSGASPEALLTLDTSLSKRARQSASRVREQEIARLAVEHHRAGRILLAIEPDLTDVEDLQNAVARCYLQHRKESSHGRAHRLTWLKTIADFESNPAKRKGNLLTLYFRLTDSWKWPRK